MSAEVVRVQREIAASPEAVFDAWTDAESLRIWMAPEPLTVGSAECDVRVGGAFRIVMIDDAGALAHWGEYEVVEPPSHLVFTWRADHLGDAVTRVHVRLEPTEAGTRMTIEHHGLPAPARPPHGQGWTSISERLARAMSS